MQRIALAVSVLLAALLLVVSSASASYCVSARSAEGAASILRGTPPEVIAAQTGGASAITDTTASLLGIVDGCSAGEDLVAWFEYGPTAAYGQTTTPQTVPGGADGPSVFAADLMGLAAQTAYHYRLVVDLPGEATYTGDDRTFTTTPARPTQPSGGQSGPPGPQGAPGPAGPAGPAAPAPAAPAPAPTSETTRPAVDITMVYDGVTFPVGAARFKISQAIVDHKIVSQGGREVQYVPLPGKRGATLEVTRPIDPSTMKLLTKLAEGDPSAVGATLTYRSPQTGTQLLRIELDGIRLAKQVGGIDVDGGTSEEALSFRFTTATIEGTPAIASAAAGKATKRRTKGSAAPATFAQLRRTTARLAASTRVAPLRTVPFTTMTLTPEGKSPLTTSAFSWTAQREIVEHKVVTGGRPGAGTKIRLIYGRATYAVQAAFPLRPGSRALDAFNGASAQVPSATLTARGGGKGGPAIALRTGRIVFSEYDLDAGEGVERFTFATDGLAEK